MIESRAKLERIRGWYDLPEPSVSELFTSAAEKIVNASRRARGLPDVLGADGVQDSIDEAFYSELARR